MSIDLFSQFAVNSVAEEQGTKTQIPECGDTLFTVAAAGNKAYNKLLQKLVKMNRAVLDSKGDAAEKKSDEILAEVMAKTILLGWEGAINFKGKETAYSYEAAKELLAHKKFRAAVGKVAEDFDVFRAVKDEEDEKN